jgi:hypothetical protein
MSGHLHRTCMSGSLGSNYETQVPLAHDDYRSSRVTGGKGCLRSHLWRCLPVTSFCTSAITGTNVHKQLMSSLPVALAYHSLSPLHWDVLTLDFVAHFLPQFSNHRKVTRAADQIYSPIPCATHSTRPISKGMVATKAWCCTLSRACAERRTSHSCRDSS